MPYWDNRVNALDLVAQVGNASAFVCLFVCLFVCVRLRSARATLRHSLPIQLTIGVNAVALIYYNDAEWSSAAPLSADPDGPARLDAILTAVNALVVRACSSEYPHWGTLSACTGIFR